jgi:copper homeostasis protein
MENKLKMEKTNKAIFEVCAFNVQSAIIAEKMGAARVELCDNPIEGGTTPSYGTIKNAREKLPILLYPIIRPRSGNYLYDADEMQIIKEDIMVCKALGCDGISIGIQKINGEIDVEKMKQVVEWAYPMGVTCNRVFDASPDPFKALEDIISTGCERILTSGQKSVAPDAGTLLRELVNQANDRVIIMPGAGINSSNIAKLRAECGATEYHGSARKIIANPMEYYNAEVSDYGNVYVTDEEELEKIISSLIDAV